MIGHSNHSWSAFAKLLTDHKVTALIDVRNYPKSFLGHFCADQLASALPALGISYHHRPALGGRHPLPETKLREHIAQLPLDAGVCLMCSEGDYTACHRHYLLAPLLLELGVLIHQIRRDGSLTQDTGPTPATLAKTRRFRPAAETQMNLFE